MLAQRARVMVAWIRGRRLRRLRRSSFSLLSEKKAPSTSPLPLQFGTGTAAQAEAGKKGGKCGGGAACRRGLRGCIVSGLPAAPLHLAPAGSLQAALPVHRTPGPPAGGHGGFA